ncbi:substrate-binding periplasmic protein [Vibrio genomosp. F10]|uniref:Amino acid ABC transporter substrate-binding protein n=1 Tax=Vibrio genomosp. F10 TaxID=723171 RepID=A0A1B9QWA0_9VIBR|nr:transporter substrate-binding domain-containing protein [Vibrio genomosp. F10]OCH73782.1 amino acid ABC transporter substrate-binding protein [Vibrio genomosp. F10]OEE94036.1 amino acid ABC transporter substrate-binding protein [Vibrio genomosp. F10 str. 9ZC157]OEF00603.1 amino acid ABC transporter substrate-binding protein [Vibrio genomosp. F10 str. 9ZD137]
MVVAMPRCHVLSRPFFFILILQLLASLPVQSTELESLSFYTENYPPANFEEKGNISGYSVDILIAAGQAVGKEITTSQISVLPWPRSYRNALNLDDAALFSTTRTEHREKLFHWVGPITDIKVVVLARKQDNITINAPIEMSKYRIGVIRDDIGEQSLLTLGIPRNSMQEATTVTVLAEQLMKGRIDLLAYDEKAAYWWASQVGIDSDRFESIYVLEEGQLYYAFNKSIEQDILAELQKGLDIIKSQKDDQGVTLHQKILNKYR